MADMSSAGPARLILRMIESCCGLYMRGPQVTSPLLRRLGSCLGKIVLEALQQRAEENYTHRIMILVTTTASKPAEKERVHTVREQGLGKQVRDTWISWS